MKVSVDFNKKIGKIKPLNGFNNASRKNGYSELLPAFKLLEPHVCRLHDTCGKYGGSHYVDIPNIFPDFSADPDDEASYDFSLTDSYIRELVDSGIAVFYRLGVTIEHEPKKYHIFPPSDFNKWAIVCEHIVRHYNCGWADGFYWNIKYWEIWNEPDGTDKNIEPFGPPNWLGSAEDYYRLYSVTANYLKEHHPDILIGGYSSCYILGKNQNGKWTSGPTEFFTDFLKYISDEKTKAPLDFFTWHGYLGKNNIDKIIAESSFVDDTLNKFGFKDTLRIDAEWNCMIDDDNALDHRTLQYVNLRNEKSASHVAGSLYLMQHCKVDMAMYYDAQIWCEYGGLFHVPSLKPTKTYYAFLQFSALRKLENWCESSFCNPVYSCAASNGNDMLCIANIDGQKKHVSLEIKNPHGSIAEIFICDGQRNLELFERITVSELNSILLPEYSFISIIIKGEK